MKAGRQLSRNLWVAKTISLSHFLPLFSIQHALHCTCTRSSSSRTVVRMMCVQQIWCCRLIWTYLEQGTDMKPLRARLTQSDIYSHSREAAVCFLYRQKPYVIRSPRRRLAVEVQLQNRLENAYNTSLTLHYSRNLHFSSLSIRVNHAATCMQHHVPHRQTKAQFLFLAGGCQL